MTATVYIVTGSTGEYSDRSEWYVRAFIDKDRAQSFCDSCTHEANALWAALDNKYDYHKLHGKHSLDPGCTWDYTGTRYFVGSCPLGEP